MAANPFFQEMAKRANTQGSELDDKKDENLHPNRSPEEVMTPSSASGSSLRRRLSPDELAKQQAANSRYQSGATWR